MTTNPMDKGVAPVLPMHLSPRCGARNRAGRACKRPASKGKRRCHMHGGAAGSCAPTGESNGAYRTGRWSQENSKALSCFRTLLRTVRE